MPMRRSPKCAASMFMQTARWRSRPQTAGAALPLHHPSAARSGSARASSRRAARAHALLQHVFRADLDTCLTCGGPMRWVEAASTRKASARLLAKLGLAPQPPPASRSDPPGQLDLPFARRCDPLPPRARPYGLLRATHPAGWPGWPTPSRRVCSPGLPAPPGS
jgi:hypothetical protein